MELGVCGLSDPQIHHEPQVFPSCLHDWIILIFAQSSFRPIIKYINITCMAFFYGKLDTLSDLLMRLHCKPRISSCRPNLVLDFRTIHMVGAALTLLSYPGVNPGHCTNCGVTAYTYCSHLRTRSALTAFRTRYWLHPKPLPAALYGH